MFNPKTTKRFQLEIFLLLGFFPNGISHEDLFSTVIVELTKGKNFLRSLQKDSLLECYKEKKFSTRFPKKIYKLTEKGKEVFDAYVEDFRKLADLELNKDTLCYTLDNDHWAPI